MNNKNELFLCDILNRYECIRKAFLKISLEGKFILPHEKSVILLSDFNLLL